MSLKQFTPDSRTTINWASGTSTEIFIYPSNGNFADRNFLFRISTATVEAEESTFSFFQGITRHLMILKGELELIHEGRYTKHLKPYEQDIFSGEWTTFSKGKVTDFNLMLKDGASGSLTHHLVESNGVKVFSAKTDHHFIYIASGTVVLNNVDTAKASDLVWVTGRSEISLQTQDTCNLIEIICSVAEN